MRRADFGRNDATAKRVLHACLGILLVAACFIAPACNYATTLKHQATGTVQSHTATEIVMLHNVGKNQTHWDFVLTHATQIPAGVNKGVRVTIYYHDDNGKRIADRIKVVAVSTPPKTK
ncbi:MAG: hypothetical protein ABSA32_11075 [Candidatus Acidiferrales bacterium]